jgi:hypothetical protein
MANNSDNSLETEADASDSSAAANGEGSSASVDNSDNSTNDYAADNSAAKALGDSAAANGDGSSASIDNSVTLAGKAVSTSLLDSSVSYNSTSVKAYDDSKQSADNGLAGSFGNASGISVAAQNVGQSAAVQQSVTVQANLGGTQ